MIHIVRRDFVESAVKKLLNVSGSVDEGSNKMDVKINQTGLVNDTSTGNSYKVSWVQYFQLIIKTVTVILIND